MKNENVKHKMKNKNKNVKCKMKNVNKKKHKTKNVH